MKKIIKKENNKPSVFLNSLSKVGGWTGVSRVFGLIRDIATTSLLGATVAHDIYVVVFKIPNVFRSAFGEGALNQAFIPVYSDFLKKGDDTKTSEFLNSVTGFLITSLFIFTILVLIFAPIFIFVFAPGFYFDPVKKSLSVEILRIMFPYLALISLVAFAGGIQNSHGRFAIPAFTPVIFNVCLIIAASLIAPYYGIPIYVLAWGVLLAGFLQLLVQYFPLLTIKKLPSPKINFKNEGLKKFLILIGPALLAGGITQINLLIDTIYASFLDTGSPTWLYVSDRLIQFPMGLFAVAVGIVLLPTLSKINLKNDKLTFIKSLQKGQRFVLFIGIPSMIGLYFCAEDLISTIFLRGEFRVIDVLQSSYSLMAFSFGLPFFMLMKVLTPAFFARKDTTTPMYIALIGLISNVILNYLLAFTFGFAHVGIAIGSSISSIITVLILEIILLRDGLIKLNSIANRFNFAVFFSSCALVIFLYYSTNYINFLSISPFERSIYLLFEVGLAVVVYFTVARLIFGKPIRMGFN